MRVDQYVAAVAADSAFADVPALLADGGQRITYPELASRITAAADALSQVGLAAGQRAVLVGE
ncbi:MAG TPA: hypothetical protein VLJ58_05460, partial [Ramlibacter sp.]|nr:hypothetical protein [Ramlibacter sp.]